jgi:hypothetical protein
MTTLFFAPNGRPDREGLKAPAEENRLIQKSLRHRGKFFSSSYFLQEIGFRQESFCRPSQVFRQASQIFVSRRRSGGHAAESA